MRPKNTRPSPLPNPDDPTGCTVLIELTQGKVAIIDACMRATVGDLTRYNFPQDDEVPV
jgi:hypothetical protein